MTTAEYRAYLQSIESGQHEPSEQIGELPSSHFGRMSAAEYRVMLHPQKQPGGQPTKKSAPQKKPDLPIPTESEEQRVVMEWAEAASGKWPELRLLYHVPNEGRRSMATGGRLRAEGLKSGVPDLCLPSAHGQYHGLYIEMKRTQGSKTTPEQKEWLAALEAEGYKTALCKGADAAIETIGAYLALPKKKRASGPINRTESPEAYEMEIKMDFEQKAIERPKLGSSVSFAHYQKPLLLTYSGGKDSDVCLELAQRAGIPFAVCHSLTTADAPQTIQHIKKKFKALELKGIHCEIIYPVYQGKRTSMWRLIEEKLIPPTRIMRYCCSVLKETAGNHRAIITGVRWDESNSRSKCGEFEVFDAKKYRVSVMPREEYEQIYLSDELYLNNDNDARRQWMESCMKQRKTTCNPIIDWPNHVLWDYIHAERINTNPLYQCGFSRIGCIGCPMAGKGRFFEFQQFPKYEMMYKHAFAKMLERHKSRPKDNATWKTADDVWNWWMNDKNLDGQIGIGDV